MLWPNAATREVPTLGIHRCGRASKTQPEIGTPTLLEAPRGLLAVPHTPGETPCGAGRMPTLPGSARLFLFPNLQSLMSNVFPPLFPFKLNTDHLKRSSTLLHPACLKRVGRAQDTWCGCLRAAMNRKCGFRAARRRQKAVSANHGGFKPPLREATSGMPFEAHRAQSMPQGFALLHPTFPSPPVPPLCSTHLLSLP